MIRKISAAEEARAKEIWKVCFGDSDAFIDAYFREAARFEDSFAYEEAGKLIADLFMLKFHAKLAGAVYDADFLAGCATMPEARKRGLMRDLVKHAMLDMRACGLACVYLHPFLHAFYRRFGFETVAYVSRRTLEPAGKANPSVRVYASAEGLPVSRMEAAYAHYMDSFDNCFVRTHERFHTWLELLFADDGYAAVYDDGKDFAYALYYKDGGIADVFELVPGSQRPEMILNHIDAGRADYFEPSAAPTAEAEEFTMMRVLDPVRLIGNARPLEDEIVLHISDEFLQEEYRLAVRGTRRGNCVRETDGKADIEVSPGELAAMLAGAGNGALFGKQTACFFETY